jgi:hypothetical protein
MPNVKGLLPKNKLGEAVSTLMGISDCSVWVHESVLFPVLKLKEGPSFGESHSLTYVLKAIEKGFVGKKNTESYFVIDQE